MLFSSNMRGSRPSLQAFRQPSQQGFCHPENTIDVPLGGLLSNSIMQSANPAQRMLVHKRKHSDIAANSISRKLIVFPLCPTTA